LTIVDRAQLLDQLHGTAPPFVQSAFDSILGEPFA